MASVHVHAHNELACTANISIAHVWILLNLAISDNQMNIVRFVWETLVTCLLGLKLATTTMKFNTNLSSNHTLQLLPAMRASF